MNNGRRNRYDRSLAGLNWGRVGAMEDGDSQEILDRISWGHITVASMTDVTGIVTGESRLKRHLANIIMDSLDR